MSLFLLIPAGTPLLDSVPSLDAMPDTILETYPTPGSERPIAGLKFDDLEGQSGGGDTLTSIITWFQFGTDWLPDGGTASDFEVYVTDVSESGAAGTKAGDVLDSWLTLGTREFRWTKDTNSVGTAIWNAKVEIREIAVPANTTGEHDVAFHAVVDT